MATFTTVDDLRAKVVQTLARLRPVAHEPSIPPPAAEPTAPPPPLPDLCLGRDDETGRIVAALTSGADRAAVLVQGPGGIGKTTLTQQAAHHPAVLARFGPRRWFAELETATDRDTFDAQLLLALGLSPTAGFAAAVERLGRAPGLLVLDNLETPWRSAGPAIEARLGQLAAIPGLALLASFRGAAAVVGARFTLRLTVDPLAERDARALFLAIAGKDKADDPHLAALLAALGGVPLAIGLTARRAAPHRRLAELWDAWQRLGPEVAQWIGQDEGRLTSVVHSIELSRQASRMTPAAHRLFALLGQCPAGLCTADRRALLGDDAFDGVEALLAVGLAIPRGDDRLDLLPPVRDHARRAHPPQGDDATAWCRHFLDRARTEGGRIYNDGGADALAALTPEVANIEAAILYAPESDLGAAAVTALNGASRLQMASGLGSAHVLLTLATACADATDRQGEAECLYRAGEVLQARSDHATAHDAYQRAATLFHDLGATREEAYCIFRLGNIALHRSDHDTAKARYEDALPLFRHVGSVVGEANCIQRLGNIALRRSDHDTAKACFEDALPLFRRGGAVLGEANCFLYLGRLAAALGDLPTAWTQAAAALPLYERMHATRNVAIEHEDLAAWTEGTERAGHIAAAIAAWRSMGLEHEIEDVQRRFGTPE